MRKGRHRFSFTLESRQSIGVLRKRRRKHFDGDKSIQTRIARFVNFPHAARTEGGHDFVRTETRSRGQGQMAASSAGILSRPDWHSGVITLRHLKAFQFSETKKPLRCPFLFEDHDVDRMLTWQRLCDVSESNGDEDDISTGHDRWADRGDGWLQFVFTIHTFRRNWRHRYSCLRRQERVGFVDHGVRAESDSDRRRRDHYVD